jgi:hypothetical protein
MPKPSFDVLKRLQALPAPRHFFVLPNWLPPGILDEFVREGYLTMTHSQRDKHGHIQVAMNLRLTPKAERLIRPAAPAWPQKALKASAAGAGFIVMSLLVFYLA